MQDLKKTTDESEVIDRVGIAVSVLCCIHCMAIPILMIAAPSLAQFFESDLIHIIALALILPLGLYAFISKIKIHSDKRPLYIGLVGMLFLVIGIFCHEFLDEEMGHKIEIISSIVGGVALIYAHILNVKLCRCNTCDH